MGLCPVIRNSRALGYRAAYATIYDRNAAAIEELKALRHDDHPNVANQIGYSHRKLGDYKLTRVRYERALKTTMPKTTDGALWKTILEICDAILTAP